MHKLHLVSVVTDEPKFSSYGDFFQLDFIAGKLNLIDNPFSVIVRSSDKETMEHIQLGLQLGTKISLYGVWDSGIFKVSYDFGGKLDLCSNYEHDVLVSSLIKQIHNEYINNIQNPLLHYLAEYPFRQGLILYGLSKIGASLGKRGIHHSASPGLLVHILEMLKAIPDSSFHSNDYEMAIVCVIWHDLGKILMVNPDNPSELVISSKSPIDHDRLALPLLGMALKESHMSCEIQNSIILQTLLSTIGNVHNEKIFHNHLSLLRHTDQLSSKFSENHNSFIKKSGEII